MTKRNSRILAGATTAVLASMMVGVTVSAQRGGGQQGPDTHGVPAPEKMIGDGKTVPVKVTTRMYDKKVLLSAPVLSEEAQIGHALYLQKCAYCHDGVGQPTYKTMGPWLGAETVKTRGEDVVRVFISNGTPRMPGFSYGLDEKQINALIAYMKTIPSTQKPTPGQLAGTTGAGGSND
jgi:mono/diheme cytochrome c family protein